jgi:hypothetical protein
MKSYTSVQDYVGKRKKSNSNRLLCDELAFDNDTASRNLCVFSVKSFHSMMLETDAWHVEYQFTQIVPCEHLQAAMTQRSMQIHENFHACDRSYFWRQ